MGKLTYKNTLFKDTKVENVGEHFDHEKGEGDEVNEPSSHFMLHYGQKKFLIGEVRLKYNQFWHFI